MKVLTAKWEEHKEIGQLAKQSPYSKGFLDMYYPAEYYKRGEVMTMRRRGKLLGFICVRHCVRKPFTSVYYMGVAITCWNQGIGRALIAAAWKRSPWKRLQLITEKENVGAMRFYMTLGFKVIGEGENKQGEPYWRMERLGFPAP